MDNTAHKINNDYPISETMAHTIIEREKRIAADPNPWVDAAEVFERIENKINAAV